MNARLLIAVCLGFSSVATGRAKAAETELADLAPARTLAYLELHDPAATAHALRALVKGSYLQRPELLLARRGGQKNQNQTNEEAYLFAWMCSSEFIDELGDLEGGFVALTGFTKSDEPEVVGVLRTGKNRMIPLALRYAMVEDNDFRCIARVEGVPIFQIGDAKSPEQPEIAKRRRISAERLARRFRAPRKTSLYQVALLETMQVEEPQVEPEFGCFVALAPGAVAFGTTPKVLADTVRRLRSKSAAPSLAGDPTFREAARGRVPGLFAWCDPRRLTGRINDLMDRQLQRAQDEIRRQHFAEKSKREAAGLKRALQQAEIEHRRELQEWTLLQRALRPAAMRYATASWSLHGGDLACRLDLRMREKQTSPLLDVLSRQKLSDELLQALPQDAFAGCSVPLADGAKTLARLVELADAYVAEGGENALSPSKQLAELEKRLKRILGREVLGKIGAMAFALQLPVEKNATVWPIALVEAKSESAAEDLVAMLPSLYSLGGKNVAPRKIDIAGQPIFSLAGEGKAPALEGPPPHYGRRGKIVVLGWHPVSVANTLRQMTSKKDLLNLRRGREAVEAVGELSALGMFSCHQMLHRLVCIASEQSEQNEGHLRALRYLRELSVPMAGMPPTMFSIKRLDDGLRIEFLQKELPSASATVIDIGLSWILDNEAQLVDGVIFRIELGNPPQNLPGFGLLPLLPPPPVPPLPTPKADE